MQWCQRGRDEVGILSSSKTLYVGIARSAVNIVRGNRKACSKTRYVGIGRSAVKHCTWE